MNPLFVLIQLQFWWNMFLGSQPLAGAEPTSPTKKDSKHRFEIIKKLGSGTYGKVSLAFDHKFDREVRSSFLIFKLEKSYRYLQSVAMGLRHNLVEDSLFMKTGAFLQSFPCSVPSQSIPIPIPFSTSFCFYLWPCLCLCFVKHFITLCTFLLQSLFNFSLSFPLSTLVRISSASFHLQRESEANAFPLLLFSPPSYLYLVFIFSLSLFPSLSVSLSPASALLNEQDFTFYCNKSIYSKRFLEPTKFWVNAGRDRGRIEEERCEQSAHILFEEPIVKKIRTAELNVDLCPLRSI